MGSIIRLAWRNLGRNRRRTAITSLALAVAIALCVATWGLVDGMSSMILHALTRLDLGHVQIHQKDFPRKRSLQYTIDEPASVLASIGKTNSKTVRGVALRVYGAALVSHGVKSAGVQLVGVDPVNEPKITVLHKMVRKGKYLDKQPTPWPRGRKLTTKEKLLDKKLTDKVEKDVFDELDKLPSLNDKKPTSKPAPKPTVDSTVRQTSLKLARTLSPPPERMPNVLIGVALARILKLKVGDKFYALSQTVDGMMAEVYFRVGGIFKTGANMYDRNRIYMHITDLQRMVHLYDRVHEIAVVTNKAKLAGRLAASLRTRIGNPKLVVRSWDVIRPDISRLLKMYQVSTAIMVFIIFLISTLGVVNTMLMAVFERTREFGVLKAIGMSGGRILALVVTETVLLVLVSSVIGTALGLGLDLYLVFEGIDLRSFTDGFSVEGIGLDPVIRGSITAIGLIAPTIILGLSCFLASFYPGARAARMQPAAGMREL